MGKYGKWERAFNLSIHSKKEGSMSFKKLIILYSFCSDYHSGQKSRGYKILCMAKKRLVAKNYDFANPNLDTILRACGRTKLYKDLVDRYGDKI